MRERQPGVKRESRNFNGKSKVETQEDPHLKTESQIRALLYDFRVVKGVRLGVEVERQKRDQHENASEQRKKEKFNGRIFLLGSAPDPDQEIHRNQCELPKHIEQEEIKPQKHADHAGLQQQEEKEIFLDAVFDIEGGDEGQERQQRRQDHQDE